MNAITGRQARKRAPADETPTPRLPLTSLLRITFGSGSHANRPCRPGFSHDIRIRHFLHSVARCWRRRFSSLALFGPDRMKPSGRIGRECACGRALDVALLRQRVDRPDLGGSAIREKMPDDFAIISPRDCSPQSGQLKNGRTGLNGGGTIANPIRDRPGRPIHRGTVQWALVAETQLDCRQFCYLCC
jgi:hypothetical protein